MASIQLSRYEAEEGDLPDVCMCCGEPATERKRLRFVSHPLWVYVLLPFGYLPYVIVAAILTEHVRCYTLFCPRHKNHWLYRTLIVWGAFVALLALLAASFALVGSMSGQINKSTQDFLLGSLCIATPALLFCWLMSIPIMQLTSIHPADATERRLTLKCISPAFVDAVREYRATQGRGGVRRFPASIPDATLRTNPGGMGRMSFMPSIAAKQTSRQWLKGARVQPTYPAIPGGAPPTNRTSPAVKSSSSVRWLPNGATGGCVTRRNSTV